jgi:SAM-dependent methyltransferase
MSRITQQDERGYNQIFAPIGSTPLRMKRRNDWLISRLERTGARRVLEIGCGTGDTAAYLASKCEAEIVAVDISAAFVTEAKSRHTAHNLRYELFDLLGDEPLALGSFDLVCGNGILHHLVKRLPAILQALNRVTNAGGGLAFIEPNLLNPYCAFIFGTRIGRQFAKLEPDEMAFTSGQLRRGLSSAGWRDVQVTTRDFLLPGLPEGLVKPTLALEPAMEATALTSWLAQSHFITAQA